MAASIIKFKAYVPVSENIFETPIKEVEFKLGMGPCGRYVDHLESKIDYHGVTITQTSYPEDWAHVNKTANTMLYNWQVADKLIHGRFGKDGYGFGNKAVMTPTEEEHKRNKEAMQAMADRATELFNQREIKTFFYKLEDVRGRIVAIQK